MPQVYVSRKVWAIAEAVTHAVVGFLIGFIVVGILHMTSTIRVDWDQNLGISTVITIANMIKAYLLRGFFHRKRKRHKRKHRSMKDETNR